MIILYRSYREERQKHYSIFTLDKLGNREYSVWPEHKPGVWCETCETAFTNSFNSVQQPIRDTRSGGTHRNSSSGPPVGGIPTDGRGSEGSEPPAFQFGPTTTRFQQQQDNSSRWDFSPEDVLNLRDLFNNVPNVRSSRYMP